MKKIIIGLLLAFLLIGCNENPAQSSVFSQPSDTSQPSDSTRQSTDKSTEVKSYYEYGHLVKEFVDYYTVSDYFFTYYKVSYYPNGMIEYVAQGNHHYSSDLNGTLLEKLEDFFFQRKEPVSVYFYSSEGKYKGMFQITDIGASRLSFSGSGQTFSGNENEIVVSSTKITKENKDTPFSTTDGQQYSSFQNFVDSLGFPSYVKTLLQRVLPGWGIK